MMQILATLAAVALFVAVVLWEPVPPVASLGAVGLALAGAGILGAWPWLVAGAAAVFLTAYAVALRISAAPAHVLAAAGFGLALLLLLQSADLARRARQARVGAGVFRAQIGGWIALAAGTLAGAILGIALARALAGSVPHPVAPPLAAASALGTLLAIAAIMIYGRPRPAEPRSRRVGPMAGEGE
jgi:hypothetical protein